MKHIDPSEINIINYLTGEMKAEEMRLFKLQLEENQLLREQIEEMKIAQSQLKLWQNDNIQIPTFEPSRLDEISNVSENNLAIQKNGIGQKFNIPGWMRYAAAFLGFVLLLQIIGLKIDQKGNTLLLSFGEPTSENLDVNSVDEIVSKAIERYAKEQNFQLVEFKNQMNSDLAKIAKTVENVTEENKLNIANLSGAFDQKMDKQSFNLETMIKGLEGNQRQDLEDSFTGLVAYIENKSVKDQYNIQNAFSEIATAINNQQYQTNALLTSISEDDPIFKSY